MRLKELREKRAAVGGEIIKMRDAVAKDNRDFNSEERAAWDKANKDFDDLGRLIETEERADSVSKALAASGRELPGAEDTKRNGSGGSKIDAEKIEEVRALALQAWFLRQLGQPLTEKHVRACKATGMRPGARNLQIGLPKHPGQFRAQSVGTTTAGGFTVPQGFVSSLEIAMKQWNAMRQVADIVRTETGNPLPWPTVNDTTNVGTLLAENTTVGAAVDMTFGQTTFGAYKFSSGLILVSSELDQDNAVNLSNIIGGLLGERLGRGAEGYFTTGTGSSQPGGVVTGAVLGKTTAAAAAITADELIDLFHSVDPAYRSDPSFGFMAHDNIIAAVRKLKDTSGRYLWQPSLQDGTPERLLNKPVTINQSMASSIATTNKTMLAGAFSKFKIRDAGPIRVRRFEERYGDIDQIGFIAFQRSDSKVLNAGGNPIKFLQQA